MSATKHRKHRRHHPVVKHDAARPEFLPDDAKVGDDPDVLALLNSYEAQDGSTTDRHIDGYAFGPNPSGDYSNFIAGAHVICYYWDSSHEAQGEYTITNGDHVLALVNEGKTSWE